MEKNIYMGSFIAMLALLAITFLVQVKSFGSGSRYQWCLLAIIIIVGLGSYYLSRRMKEERWFHKQQSSVRAKRKPRRK